MQGNTEKFIGRWERSSASERANYALFLSELCDHLDLPRPEPSQADESANIYVIDKAVVFQNLTVRRQQTSLISTSAIASCLRPSKEATRKAIQPQP
jgi:hypothetical protein